MFLHRMAAQRHNMALKHYILEWYLILVPPKFFFSSLGPLSQSRQQMAAPWRYTVRFKPRKKAV